MNDDEKTGKNVVNEPRPEKPDRGLKRKPDCSTTKEKNIYVAKKRKVLISCEVPRI